ncbi:FAD-binding dehydrogenase, partial [Morganella morganii]
MVIRRFEILLTETIDKLAELKERFRRVEITDRSSVFN